MIEKIDIYLREIEKMDDISSSIDDDIDRYLSEKLCIKSKKERTKKIKEIKDQLIKGGIINE